MIMSKVRGQGHWKQKFKILHISPSTS